MLWTHWLGKRGTSSAEVVSCRDRISSYPAEGSGGYSVANRTRIVIWGGGYTAFTLEEKLQRKRGKKVRGGGGGGELRLAHQVRDIVERQS